MITSLIDVLAVLLPVLITVAYVTLLERKALASMQRRIGPDTVGLYGVGQPFADALKLLVKELVMPQQAQKAMFVISPAIALITALLGWAVIPFGSGLVISDLELGWLFYLAAASVGVYGIIFSGWAGNSVFAFMGALRSTAQLISYELALGAAALTTLVLAGTFNLSLIIEGQQAVWYAVPLLPIFLLFLITCLAEVNRTPFDLAEAESELVAGFFTEHSAFLFVAFFLAEYCSIALISTITAILWLGGYSMPFALSLPWFFNASAIVLGIKVVTLIFGIIWVRGTLPRLRYDQLMALCWFILLPVVFGLIVLVFSLMTCIGPHFFSCDHSTLALAMTPCLALHSRAHSQHTRRLAQQYAKCVANYHHLCCLIEQNVILRWIYITLIGTTVKLGRRLKDDVLPVSRLNVEMRLSLFSLFSPRLNKSSIYFNRALI